MASPTQADRHICREVGGYGFEVSTREVRTLREHEIIETVGSKSGGRGRVAKYKRGTTEVVVSIERAKLDPLYRRKLYRAVFIAWIRGAAVGTAGLKWAYRRHFESEERVAKNRIDWKRVEEDEPDFDFPPEFYRSLAKAKMGRRERPADLAAFERHTGATVRDAISRSRTPDLLPEPRDGTSLGIAVQQRDGSWAVPQMGSQLWEALAFRPQATVAKTALREELDTARTPSREIMRASGFEPSDLVVAAQVPKTIEWLRKWHGRHWWVASSKSSV